MANVDPFIIEWPREWIDNQNLRPALEYLNRFLHDLHIRSGGGTDAIENIAVQNTFNWNTNRPSNNTGNPYSSIIHRAPEYRAVSINQQHTASAYEWIDARSSANIKFPQYPKENDEFIIRVGDNSDIPIDGNGKKINGSTSGVLRGEGRSITFKWFINRDEWYPK